MCTRILAAAVPLLVASLSVAGVSAQHTMVVPSDVASKSAYVTNKGINWYQSLDQARAEARREGKLVFWLHMLGSINGAT